MVGSWTDLIDIRHVGLLSRMLSVAKLRSKLPASQHEGRMTGSRISSMCLVIGDFHYISHGVMR